jgi:hypothetical protein
LPIVLMVTPQDGSTPGSSPQVTITYRDANGRTRTQQIGI